MPCKAESLFLLQLLLFTLIDGNNSADHPEVEIFLIDWSFSCSYVTGCSGLACTFTSLTLWATMSLVCEEPSMCRFPTISKVGCVA